MYTVGYTKHEFLFLLEQFISDPTSYVCWFQVNRWEKSLGRSAWSGESLFCETGTSSWLKGDQWRVTRESLNRHNNFFLLIVVCCGHCDVCFCSIAILLYLAEKYKTQDFWYPADLCQRARITEYLSWQHMAIRWHGSRMFWLRVRQPLMKITILTSLPCPFCVFR